MSLELLIAYWIFKTFIDRVRTGGVGTGRVRLGRFESGRVGSSNLQVIDLQADMVESLDPLPSLQSERDLFASSLTST